MIDRLREEIYQNFQRRKDAGLDLIDALTSAEQVESPVAVSESPLFRHKFGSVYDVLEESRMDKSCSSITQWQTTVRLGSGNPLCLLQPAFPMLFLSRAGAKLKGSKTTHKPLCLGGSEKITIPPTFREGARIAPVIPTTCSPFPEGWHVKPV